MIDSLRAFVSHLPLRTTNLRNWAQSSLYKIPTLLFQINIFNFIDIRELKIHFYYFIAISGLDIFEKFLVLTSLGMSEVDTV